MPTDDPFINRRAIWIAVGAFVGVLFVSVVLLIAYRVSARLYANMYATDEKQTQYIFELDKRMQEMERKLAVFEANLKYEAKAAQEKGK